MHAGKLERIGFSDHSRGSIGIREEAAASSQRTSSTPCSPS
jgi:hypothetical protein